MTTKKSKLGRRGDPRMHKAVAARLKNPNLTLLDALREGGFNYPQEALNMGTFSDADNIQLCQRKNQLSRRLRFARRRNSRMEKENAEGTDDTTSECGSSVSVKERKNSSITTKKRKEMEDDEVLPSNDKNNDKNYHHHPRNLQEFYLTSLPVVPAKCNKTLPVAPPPINISCPNRQRTLTTTTNSLPLASKVTPTSNNEMAQSFHSNVDHRFDDKMEHIDPPQLIFTNHDSNTSTASSHHNHPNTNITNLTTKNAIHSIKTEDLSIDKNELFNDKYPSEFVLDSKIKNALSIFRAEISSLLKKSMLSAGFEGSQTDECDSTYVAFARAALRIEMNRIERLNSLIKATKDIHENNSKISLDATKKLQPHNHTAEEDHTCRSSNHNNHNNHNHNHDHNHDDDDSNKKQNNSSKKQNCFEGRHIHRLEGKCGHKAIIHKPENGPAHVDFVVNGKVECYQGFKPVGKDISDAPLWPSKYSCAQLTCEKKKEPGHSVRVSTIFLHFSHLFF